LSKAAGFLVRPPLPPPAAASCGRFFCGTCRAKRRSGKPARAALPA